jgi:hypothetical protein
MYASHTQSYIDYTSGEKHTSDNFDVSSLFAIRKPFDIRLSILSILLVACFTDSVLRARDI